jgi:hypothetical protein
MNAAQPHLHLVVPEPPRSLPDVAHLLRRNLRRPGHLHEAIELPERARASVALALARTPRLGVETTAALLLEARLLLGELASALSAPRELLTAAAGRQSAIDRGHSAAEADYMRGLLHPASGHGGMSACADVPTIVALPFRLLARVNSADIDDLFDAELIEDAVSWERAALTTGATMLEWGLAVALRASR